MKARSPFLRLLLAHVLVCALGAGAYAALLPMVLESPLLNQALRQGVVASVAALALLLVQGLLLRPHLEAITRACEGAEPPALEDVLALHGAPRRAAGLLALFGLWVLGTGYLPLAGVPNAGRAIATDVGAVCVALSSLVLYASVRFALRPLAEALPTDAIDDLFVDEHTPAADRLTSRVALAIAVPASAAALIATLLVSTHLQRVEHEERFSALEAVSAAVRVEPVPEETPRGIELSAGMFRSMGYPVTMRDGRAVVNSTPPIAPRTPVAPLVVAVVVALIFSQVGRRVGRDASRDLRLAAERLAGVSPGEIRSVTMAMARPRSIPEVREMALALDTLAGVLLQISEDQRRALATRTEASRVRSFILASVSHDLRGPLNSVLGFAELLLSDVEGPLTAEQRESVEALGRGGRDLLRLVADLLDHARIDAGRMSLDRARTSVDSLVEKSRIAALERAKIPTNEDPIALEGEAGLHVIGDGERLSHALGSLLAFALVRPGADGRVAMRTRGEADLVTFVIHGGGSTPSREAMAKMFEPFDFAPTGARAPAGLNLAVSVARGVLALHGGTVLAEPAEDGGVTLRVALPVAMAS